MLDPIIDLIIRIKNGYMAGKDIVSSPLSKYKTEVLKKLKEIGMIKNFIIDNNQLRIELAYIDKQPVVTDFKIHSTPGRRIYIQYKDLKPVIGGVGHAILSTPKGILTNREAKKQKLGGELLFDVW